MASFPIIVFVERNPDFAGRESLLFYPVDQGAEPQSGFHSNDFLARHVGSKLLDGQVGPDVLLSGRGCLRPAAKAWLCLNDCC